MIGVLPALLVRDEWKMNRVDPCGRSWALEVTVLVGAQGTRLVFMDGILISILDNGILRDIYHMSESNIGYANPLKCPICDVPVDFEMNLR
jgi:hypothetical protein